MLLGNDLDVEIDSHFSVYILCIQNWHMTCTSSPPEVYQKALSTKWENKHDQPTQMKKS